MAEILIVIAILILIAAVTIPVYDKMQFSTQLNEASNLISQDLRLAKQKAQAEAGNSAYGVKFDANSYIVYKGDSFETRDENYDFPVDLGNELNISTTLNNDEINFDKGSGEPDNIGTITITNSFNNEKKISINWIGTIEET